MGVSLKYLFFTAVLLVCSVVNGQNPAQINGYEFVDLGLSVRWAKCNIGAHTPEDYGDYFAWGETYTKSSYNRMSYKYFGETYDRFSYTKYLGDNNPYDKDDFSINMEDDAAFVLWGAPWRMPSKAEIDEIVRMCDWVFDKVNDVQGCWAISKVNGNKIFFPLAGYKCDDELLDSGLSGKYWGGEIRKDMCFEAYQIWISYKDSLAEMEKKTMILLSDDGYREYGRPIRPVCPIKD